VDVRSGASSHELTGHGGGITAVQWSPTMPVVLASGSKDGSVRLWDIRKSGSRACITVCNREVTGSSSTSKPYKADYSHLRASTKKNTKLLSKKRKLNATSLAPNYYRHLQSQNITSHAIGHVAAVSFFPCGQYLASVGGVDGELLVWDLRESGTPRRLTSKFVSPGGRPAATPRRRKAILKVCNNTIWVGCNHHLLGFGMDGGSPNQILRGHLNTITSLDQLEPGRNLVTGSHDGMVLSWGKPRIASFASTVPVLKDDCDNW
jgi:WD40 repeat protein